MKDHRHEFPVGKMCIVFKVSKCGFYRNLGGPPSNRDNENRMLLFQIGRIHQQCGATYGSPRMTAELRAQGFKVSRPRVARLMRQKGIRAVHAKKFVVTTDSKHKFPVSPNLLDRNFSACAKAETWVSDITYIRTKRGWVYLTAIIDLFDRKAIGWALSTDLSAESTSMAAWRMAVRNRPPRGRLTFHSDRGVQYACTAFRNLLGSCPETIQSMSRKGNCWDNAVAESFFKTLKVELVYRKSYARKEQAALDVFQWIETIYNRTRRHSALGNLTIVEFEKLNRIKNVA